MEKMILTGLNPEDSRTVLLVQEGAVPLWGLIGGTMKPVQNGCPAENERECLERHLTLVAPQARLLSARKLLDCRWHNCHVEIWESRFHGTLFPASNNHAAAIAHVSVDWLSKIDSHSGLPLFRLQPLTEYVIDYLRQNGRLCAA